MKRVILIVVLSTMIEVFCAPALVRQSNSDNLPQHDVIGLRDGYIQLRTGQIVSFKKAIFTCNTTMIRLESEMVHQTVLWANVKRIYIENDFSILDSPDFFKQPSPEKDLKKKTADDIPELDDIGYWY